MKGHPEHSGFAWGKAKGGDPAEERILSLLARLRRRAFALAFLRHLCRGITLSWGAYLILSRVSYGRGWSFLLSLLPLAFALLASLRRPTPFEVAEAIEARFPLQGRLVAYLEFRGRSSPLMPLLIRDTAERLKDVTPEQALPFAWPRGAAIALTLLLLGTGALRLTNPGGQEEKAGRASRVAGIPARGGVGARGSAPKGAIALRSPSSASFHPAGAAPEPQGPGRPLRQEALGAQTSSGPLLPPIQEMPGETGRIRPASPLSEGSRLASEDREGSGRAGGLLSSALAGRPDAPPLPSPRAWRGLQGGRRPPERAPGDIARQGPGGAELAGPVGPKKGLAVDRFHLRGEGPLGYYGETRGPGGARQKIAYPEIFVRYQEAVGAAFSRQEIPPGYRRTVRDYFDAIAPEAILEADR